MFDFLQNLPKHLRTFWHENSVLMIGITDQSNYSKSHFIITLFIRAVNVNYNDYQYHQRKTTCTFIYTQKSNKIAKLLYIQKARHFSKSKKICVTFLD